MAPRQQGLQSHGQNKTNHGPSSEASSIEPVSTDQSEYKAGESDSASRESSTSFLDLPPELRNMVYDLLLVPRRHDCTREQLSCHPQILATCKQIHSEASSILHETRAIPLWIKLGARGHRDPHIRPQYQHALRVSLNRKDIFDSTTSESSQSIPWPICLTKFALLDIHIWSIGAVVDDPREMETGDIQLDWAICSLHKFWSQFSLPRIIDILVTTFGPARGPKRMYSVLSPLCALCADARRVNICGYTNLPSLLPDIREAMRAHRTVRSHGDGVSDQRALEPKVIPPLHPPLPTDRWPTPVPGIYRYAKASELQGAIAMIDGAREDGRGGENAKR